MILPSLLDIFFVVILGVNLLGFASEDGVERKIGSKS